MKRKRTKDDLFKLAHDLRQEAARLKDMHSRFPTNDAEADAFKTMIELFLKTAEHFENGEANGPNGWTTNEQEWFDQD